MEGKEVTDYRSFVLKQVEDGIFDKDMLIAELLECMSNSEIRDGLWDMFLQDFADEEGKIYEES